jgi:hypothetical protein
MPHQCTVRLAWLKLILHAPIRRMVPAREALIAVKNDAPTHHFTKFLARRLQSEPTRIGPPTFNWAFITG